MSREASGSAREVTPLPYFRRWSASRLPLVGVQALETADVEEEVEPAEIPAPSAVTSQRAKDAPAMPCVSAAPIARGNEADAHRLPSPPVRR
jgi:hypothetical protein